MTLEQLDRLVEMYNEAAWTFVDEQGASRKKRRARKPAPIVIDVDAIRVQAEGVSAARQVQGWIDEAEIAALRLSGDHEEANSIRERQARALLDV